MKGLTVGERRVHHESNRNFLTQSGGQRPAEASRLRFVPRDSPATGSSQGQPVAPIHNQPHHQAANGSREPGAVGAGDLIGDSKID